ncbi:hypothetical protein PMI16_01045 [Herbaspirillum sp. CF444]|nr:hypothetical protein PMI16_01045 [Herbaspirillum sp. CF444]
MRIATRSNEARYKKKMTSWTRPFSLSRIAFQTAAICVVTFSGATASAMEWAKFGKMIGVQPVSVVRKSYLLFSSKTGANPNTIASLAEDFIEFLDKEKRL